MPETPFDSKTESSPTAMTAPVGVVMAVFRPHQGYFDQQIASLAAQDMEFRLFAVIADGESADLTRRLCEQYGVSVDTVSPPGTPLKAREAFEAGLVAALAAMPDPDTLFAFCDQDDIWYPNRLSATAAELRRTGAAMVHCDARLVDGEGNELHPSMHRAEERDSRPDLRRLLYRNCVTGMASTFTRDVAELAVPFPLLRDGQYHDFWVAALAATQRSGLVFIDRALIDYRQHGTNVLGSALTRPFRKLRPLSRAWMSRGRSGLYGSSYMAALIRRRLLERKKDTASVENALRPFLFEGRPSLIFLRDSIKIYRSGPKRNAILVLSFSPVLWQTLLKTIVVCKGVKIRENAKHRNMSGVSSILSLPKEYIDALFSR